MPYTSVIVCTSQSIYFDHNSRMSVPNTPVTELFSLQGKTVIATGATGGIGSNLCIALAEAGANIVSIQLPCDPALPDLQAAIIGLGRTFTSFECDLSDSKALRSTFADIWAAGVEPDILLNCAGLNRRGPIESMEDADIDLVG